MLDILGQVFTAQSSWSRLDGCSTLSLSRLDCLACLVKTPTLVVHSVTSGSCTPGIFTVVIRSPNIPNLHWFRNSLCYFFIAAASRLFIHCRPNLSWSDALALISLSLLLLLFLGSDHSVIPTGFKTDTHIVTSRMVHPYHRSPYGHPAWTHLIDPAVKTSTDARQLMDLHAPIL